MLGYSKTLNSSGGRNYCNPRNYCTSPPKLLHPLPETITALSQNEGHFWKQWFHQFSCWILVISGLPETIEPPPKLLHAYPKLLQHPFKMKGISESSDFISFCKLSFNFEASWKLMTPSRTYRRPTQKYCMPVSLPFHGFGNHVPHRCRVFFFVFGY